MTPEEELDRYLLRARLQLEEHCLVGRDDPPSPLLDAFVDQEPSSEPLTLASLTEALEVIWSIVGRD